jgi:hypothetical protein
MLERKQLSPEDLKYLDTKEGIKLADAGDQQTWTLANGQKLVGRLVSYGRKDVTVQRRRGSLYVNDRLFDNLPEIYQRMLPKIVSHFTDEKLESKKDLMDWAIRQKGQPRTFVCDGVMLELENGDEYAIPFIFFSEKDLQVLKPGWDRWLAAKEDTERRQEEDLRLRAQAEAYQADRRTSQQIAAMQLMMSAVDAGVVDLWEVYLEPRPGLAAPPRFAVVPARNSQQAVELALAKNPNFVAGQVRKLR